MANGEHDHADRNKAYVCEYASGLRQTGHDGAEQTRISSRQPILCRYKQLKRISTIKSDLKAAKQIHQFANPSGTLDLCQLAKEAHESSTIGTPTGIGTRMRVL